MIPSDATRPIGGFAEASSALHYRVCPLMGRRAKSAPRRGGFQCSEMTGVAQQDVTGGGNRLDVRIASASLGSRSSGPIIFKRTHPALRSETN